MIKNYFIIFFFFTIIWQTQAQKEIKVGAFSLYPAIFMDSDGIVKGFYVDSFKEIEEKENIKFTYVFGTWDEGLQNIKSERIDLMTSVGYSDERNTYMDYCPSPMLTVWGEVYVLSDSDIDGILDLKNKKIAVMKSDMNAKHLKELTRKLSVDCHYIEVDDSDQVFKLIATHKVDAGVVNNTFGAGKYQEYGLRSSGIVFNPFDIFFTVKKNKNTELLALLNTYLRKWKHDNNSIFNTARQRWSHGKVGTIQVFPKRLQEILWATALVLVVLVIFVILLRYRVKVATRKVKKSEAIFKTFMDKIDGFVYIKNERLEHIYKNIKVSELNIKDQYLVKPEGALFDEETIELINASDRKILRGEANQLELVYSATVNGKRIWLHALKFRLELPNEEPKVGGFSYDITKLKETEFELIKAKEMAEESGRLKTAFLNNMSHEIRTPLNAIVGFSQLLNNAESTDEDKADYISIIHNSSNHLLSIVSDILTISHLETDQELLHIEEVNLHQLVNNLQVVFNQQLKDKPLEIRINTILTDKQGIVKTDKTKVTQILSNLISNALKFTSKGHVEIGYELSEAFYKFYVKDTGIGIPLEFREVIFERFRQVDITSHHRYGGNGLGLAISKGFVDLLGGEIWVESELGKGSTFNFSFLIEQIEETSF